MIEAVFFDIDGTLVPYGQPHIPEDAEAALSALHEKGIRLALCTGRPPGALRLLNERVRNFPWDGVITANGQLCRCGDNVIRRECISKETLHQLVPWIKEKQIPAVFFELEETYTSCRILSLEEHYRRSGWGDRLPPILDPERSYTHETLQICPYVPPEVDAEFLAHAPGMRSERWADHFADMIPENGGKDRGIEAMLEYWHISRDSCMAVGDGANDRSMIAYAPYGVAMANAPDTVKAAADYVTSLAEEGGLVQAFRHYGLID